MAVEPVELPFATTQGRLWRAHRARVGAIATSNPALARLCTGPPTIQREGLVDRPVLKAGGMRGVLWVHVVGMRVPTEQGRSGLSGRGLDSASSSCEHMTQRTRP
jgi:hypothetical protein